MLRILAAASALFAGALLSAHAEQQPAAAPGPEFEVASIKRNADSQLRGPGARSIGRQPGGRWFMTEGSVQTMIRVAYPTATEIVGAPDWTLSERYDVQAQAAENDPSPEQLSRMMRALLAGRFKLVAHDEVRERPTYALVLARTDGRLGPQLRRYDGDCEAYLAAARQGRERPAIPTPANGAIGCGSSITGTRMIAGGIRLAQLAGSVQGLAGRRIIDKTGLTGFFEFTLDRSDGLSIFTALEEQLGLTLEAESASLPVVVIDQIERPTPD